MGGPWIHKNIPTFQCKYLFQICKYADWLHLIFACTCAATVYALLCRMFISVLISFPFHWPFQIKCNSEFKICIIIGQPLTTLLSSGPWGSAMTWLTHGPFRCDDNVTHSECGCRNFSSDSRKILSLSGACGSRSWLIWDLTLRSTPDVQIKDLNSYWLKGGRPGLPLAASCNKTKYFRLRLS